MLVSSNHKAQNMILFTDIKSRRKLISFYYSMFIFRHMKINMKYAVSLKWLIIAYPKSANYGAALSALELKMCNLLLEFG